MSSKIKITILFVVFGSVRLLAQNMPYYDDKLFHFGFSLGTNLTHFNVTPSLEPQLDGKTYDVRCSGLVPGFVVGGVVDLRLHKNLNLRFTPNLAFAENVISYKDVNAPTDAPADFKYNEFMMIPISIPLYLKYSANRIGNYRPYIIGGGGVRFDVGRDKEKPILLQSTDYFVEFGFGCDTYFSFFKFAPEIKFAIGFNDLITRMDQRPYFDINDDKKYTQAIDRMLSRMLTLTFHFE